jgi:hypothetical protein
MILSQINSTLATVSPLFIGHISDFDIHLYRGAYSLENIEFRLREHPEERFFMARNVDLSISWRKILEGKLTMDIAADKASVILTDQVMKAFQKNSKQAEADSKKVASHIFPMRIERVDVRNSDFQFADLLSIPEAERWKMTNIQGRMSNVTATKEVPASLLTLQASLFGSSPVKLVATLNTVDQPITWDTDAELKGFQLPNANGWLKKKLPLTFTSGTLDLYSEIRSQNGRIEGYVKPFVHKADVIAQDESFKGLKHFGIEVTTAMANLILRNAKEKTLATKVLFSYEAGKFQINSAKALSEAIKNGFSEKINEGLDNEISLSDQKLKPKDKP